LILKFTVLVIQYGYVVLFAAAFPLAPAIVLIGNMIELRVDAAKLLTQRRRPEYLGSDGIGVWEYVFEFLSVIGVVTNCLLIAFSQETLKAIVSYLPVEVSSQPVWVLAIAMIIEHFLLGSRFLVGLLIPDVPAPISTKRAIVKYTKDLVLKKQTGEDDEGDVVEIVFDDQDHSDLTYDVEVPVPEENNPPPGLVVESHSETNSNN
jgi:hypothetical protein